jgi:hypothetical protein
VTLAQADAGGSPPWRRGRGAGPRPEERQDLVDVEDRQDEIDVEHRG